ncbi:MAG TPA: pyridoxal phosphate-dependent aminotransferase [Pyrinomonadaceae bacterium]|nr:pyridoxal phosphate-dependent aminotransferase [Pyrinomonadaceae bacterium]
MSSFPVSDNVARMQSSATMAAMQAAQALRASGANVCDFGAGEPDFDTPESIKQAAFEAMRAGRTKYTAAGGVREIHRAIVDFYQREFGNEYQPSEVMVTAGGKQAIFNAVVTLINPGDEVLIPKPYWVTFPEVVVFAGGTPVYIETEATDFVLTADQVAAAVTPRTRLLILNSPSNPSGRVLPPEEFRRIMELTAERGIYVISDECYLRFVYPPARVFSAASLPAELRARLCIAGSFSKTYAMTGWRIGYALAPTEWTKAMLKVQGHSTSNANSIAQWAAIAALTGEQESVAAMLAEYTTRRAWLLTALREIPGIKCFEPEGAFYAFPDVRGCLNNDLKTSADFSQQLLEQEHVVVTDGAGFGTEGFVRISYATSMEQIQEGVRRIKRFAEKNHGSD